jgi:hypothetical protein
MVDLILFDPTKVEPYVGPRFPGGPRFPAIEGTRSGDHGVIKLALVTVVRIIVERKRRRGDREVEGVVPYRVGLYHNSLMAKCRCNRKAPCWKSWRDDNLGRRYYGAL